MQADSQVSAKQNRSGKKVNGRKIKNGKK